MTTEAEQEKCLWAKIPSAAYRIDDDEDYFKSSCFATWNEPDYVLREWKYCPYCGKPIEVKESP